MYLNNVSKNNLLFFTFQIYAVADHVQNSGTNRFVLKPETPQLVFYCTI